LIKYPICESFNGMQGVSTQKYSGLLTFILQDENKGLQVEIDDNEWIDVIPIHN
jgi:isopenicillin N synthase-like dioxygenase